MLERIVALVRQETGADFELRVESISYKVCGVLGVMSRFRPVRLPDVSAIRPLTLRGRQLTMQTIKLGTVGDALVLGQAEDVLSVESVRSKTALWWRMQSF